MYVNVCGARTGTFACCQRMKCPLTFKASGVKFWRLSLGMAQSLGRTARSIRMHWGTRCIASETALVAELRSESMFSFARSSSFFEPRCKPEHRSEQASLGFVIEGLPLMSNAAIKGASHEIEIRSHII